MHVCTDEHKLRVIETLRHRDLAWYGLHTGIKVHAVALLPSEITYALLGRTEGGDRGAHHICFYAGQQANLAVLFAAWSKLQWDAM